MLKEINLETWKEELTSHGSRKTTTLFAEENEQPQTLCKLREGLKSWLWSDLYLFFFFPF